MLYYRYEEEKGHDPEAPELDRSLRALSSRWSDEGSQEGSEQEGMPRKSKMVDPLIMIVTAMAVFYTCLWLIDKVVEEYDNEGR